MAVTEVLRLRADVERLKAAFGEALIVGTVEHVDAERGYRINLGEGTEGPMLSPWLPHPESGGQTSSWMPLSKGQIVSLFSPSGDLRQGVLMRAGFGGENNPPSQELAANVLEAFGIRLSMVGGVLRIEADRLEVSASGIDMEADTTALVGTVKLGSRNADRKVSGVGHLDTDSDALTQGADDVLIP